MSRDLTSRYLTGHVDPRNHIRLQRATSSKPSNKLPAIIATHLIRCWNLRI